jgi:hypothetical protein
LLASFNRSVGIFQSDHVLLVHVHKKLWIDQVSSLGWLRLEGSGTKGGKGGLGVLEDSWVEVLTMVGRKERFCHDIDLALRSNMQRRVDVLRRCAQQYAEALRCPAGVAHHQTFAVLICVQGAGGMVSNFTNPHLICEYQIFCSG